MGLGSLFGPFRKKAQVPAIKVQYVPDTGIVIDGQSISWGMERNVIRQILNYQHREHDYLIDNAEFFDGDKSFNINVISDIYENIRNGENHLSFSYNDEQRLTYIEIYSGVEIKLNTNTISFDEEITKCVKQLQSFKHNCFETDEGNFFFPGLKMVIASAESMGGDGTRLNYFYCAKDVSHLDEEITED